MNGPSEIDGVMRFADDDPINMGDPVEALNAMLAASRGERHLYLVRDDQPN